MILVTGATGVVGRLAVAELLRHGLPVRALSRDPSAARLPSAAEVVGGDLDDPLSLPPVLAGVDRVLLIAPGPHQAVHHRHLVRAASHAGFGHIVALSSLAAAERSPTRLGDWHRAGEAALLDGEVAWTILRANGFMSNALAWVPDIRAHGVVRAPFARLAATVVDPRDIAAAAVAALTVGGDGRIHHLTGPQALTPAEQTAVLAAVLGRPLTFEELTVEQARTGLARTQPPEVVDALIESRSTADDDRGVVSGDVKRLLGRPPTPFADWVADHRAAFTPPSGPGGGAVTAAQAGTGVGRAG